MFFLALFLSSVERLKDKGTNTIGSRLNRMEEKVSTRIFVLQPEQGLAKVSKKDIYTVFVLENMLLLFNYRGFPYLKKTPKTHNA